VSDVPVGTVGSHTVLKIQGYRVPLSFSVSACPRELGSNPGSALGSLGRCSHNMERRFRSLTLTAIPQAMTMLEIIAAIAAELNVGDDAAKGMKSRVRSSLLYLWKFAARSSRKASARRSGGG
jgi:hypothetical protein